MNSYEFFEKATALKIDDFTKIEERLKSDDYSCDFDLLRRGAERLMNLADSAEALLQLLDEIEENEYDN